MAESKQDDAIRLVCLIEGKSNVFVVSVRRDDLVDDLRCFIHKKAQITLKDIDTYNLELWKVSDEWLCKVVN